jgi:hypothetical protein
MEQQRANYVPAFDGLDERRAFSSAVAMELQPKFSHENNKAPSW